MVAHVDLYSASAIGPTYAFIKELPPTDVARAARNELPYWNGYIYYTDVHEEDKCEQHAPKNDNGIHLSPRFRAKNKVLTPEMVEALRNIIRGHDEEFCIRGAMYTYEEDISLFRPLIE